MLPGFFVICVKVLSLLSCIKFGLKYYFAIGQILENVFSLYLRARMQCPVSQLPSSMSLRSEPRRVSPCHLAVTSFSAAEEIQKLKWRRMWKGLQALVYNQESLLLFKNVLAEALLFIFPYKWIYSHCLLLRGIFLAAMERSLGYMCVIMIFYF